MGFLKRPTLPVALLATGAILIASVYNSCGNVEFAGLPGTDDVNRLGRVATVLINDGAEFTNQASVILSLSADTPVEMKISTTPDCSDGEWEPYVEKKSWTLESLNQEASVHVVYRDAEGGESACVSDGIVHDDIAPTVAITSQGPLFTNQTARTIAFFSDDKGSGIALQECSADAGTAFKTCQGSFSLSGLKEGEQRIQIRAHDRAGNVSQPASQNWVVDVTPPVLMINRQPAALVNSMTARLEFSATDALSPIGKFQCDVDQSGFADCASPFARIFSSEGPKSIKVRALDMAGNISEPKDIGFAIDVTAPVVTLTKTPLPFSNLKSPTFEFSGKDGTMPITDFECSVDSGSFVACRSPYIPNLTTDRSYLFSVRGKDMAGNWSAPVQYRWLLDTIAPELRWARPLPKATLAPELRLEFVSSDSGSGVESATCEVNGAASACSSPYLTKLDKEGLYKAKVIAYDRAGNVSPEIIADWVADRTPPIVTIAKKPAPLTAETIANIEFSATDSGSGVVGIECRKDNGAYEPCLSPKSYKDLVAGSQSVMIRATDLAGNVSAVAMANWVVDLLGPEIRFTKYPMTTVRPGDPIEVAFDIVDVPAGVKEHSCRLDGAVFSPCMVQQVQKLPPLALGTHRFRVEAIDLVGNSSSKEIAIEVAEAFQKVLNVRTVADSNNNRVDILFVVDNSGSMKQEQANLRSRIAGFIDKIVSLDWRIGVTTTDMVKEKGNLLPIRSPIDEVTQQYVLAKGNAYADSRLGHTLEMGTGGSGAERGICAAYNSIQKLNDVNYTGPLKSFYRSDAAKAFIVISDEDESGTEVCDKPENFVSLVREKFPQVPLAWHSIVHLPGVTCSTGDGVGLTYQSLSQLTGGLLGSVCEANYTNQLQAIGQAVQNLPKTLPLDCEPKDVDGNGQPDMAIAYRANAGQPYQPVMDAYVISGLKLEFAAPLRVGEYEVTYYCAPAMK